MHRQAYSIWSETANAIVSASLLSIAKESRKKNQQQNHQPNMRYTVGYLWWEYFHINSSDFDD